MCAGGLQHPPGRSVSVVAPQEAVSGAVALGGPCLLHLHVMFAQSKMQTFFLSLTFSSTDLSVRQETSERCFETTIYLQNSTTTSRCPFVFIQHLCSKSTMRYLYNLQSEQLSSDSQYFGPAAGPASLSSATGHFDSRKVSGSEEQRTWEEGFVPC